LSDFWPHGAVADLYGVFRPRDGYCERAILVIDKNGYIRYIDIHDIDEKPDNDVLRNVLRELETGATKAPAGKPLVGRNEPETSKTDLIQPGSFMDLPGGIPGVPKGEIVLYCASWCKDCRKAKAWLAERGIPYVEVDVDSNMAARNQVRRWANGFLVTPVIDVNGTIVLDFDVPKLEEALRARGK
ncbi:MAG TPA: glutaredoxin domain-containing protein, partial [Anaerolineaceae bacterium]